eukprot:COSAG04_NODE_18674_length_435_cov_0.687500_1_plen_31_part_01
MASERANNIHFFHFFLQEEKATRALAPALAR